MQIKPYRGQQVQCGNQIGTVIRMRGPHAVEVFTQRERPRLEGFPERVTGTYLWQGHETWRLVAIEPINK